MAKTPSLIFMPDISGFTNFVQNTEIEHSQHIISELLELLIDQNEVELELAEIEGDALFYYKHTDVLSAEKVMNQARRMYQAFHKHLMYYENNRICNCGACRTTPELELKFIIHGGPFDFIKVKESVKPYGPDVIKAHRFLKNKVEIDEYILISDHLADLWNSDNTDFSVDKSWASQSVEFDGQKNGYRYLPIGEWKNNLHEVPHSIVDEAKMDILKYGVDIGVPSRKLFEMLSNLKYRSVWNNGVDSIEFDEGKVNRAGTKHVCVIGDKNLHFETIKPDIESDQLVYAERTESIPGFSYVDTYFILDEKEGTTHLETKLIGKPSSFLTSLARPFISYKAKQQIKLQIGQLKALVEADG